MISFLIQYVKERLILTFYTTSWEEGCLKGGVVGEKYIPYFKEPLPFHLPPPPLGYSSSREEEN